MCLHSPTVLWTGSLSVVLLEFYFALFGNRVVHIGIEAEILVQPPECSYSPVPLLILLAMLSGQKACLWLLCSSLSSGRCQQPTFQKLVAHRCLESGQASPLSGTWPCYFAYSTMTCA